jgi:hypothetical protein
VKNSAIPSPKITRRFYLSALLMTVLFVWPGCQPKMKFPGQLYVLAQSNIYAVGQDASQMLLSDVAAAALSPDGHYLLSAQKDRTILMELSTGDEKPVLSEGSRTVGWNSDGSRFFVVTGCETNRLYAGKVDGTVAKIYQGTKGVLAPAEDGSSPGELTCGELSGCLFLDKDSLVFSAFEGSMSGRTDLGEISANKAHLVRLDTTPPQFQTIQFPRQVRWKFVDISADRDLVLVSVEKNPENASSFEQLAYLSPRFQEWRQLSFENEIPLSISRWETESWGIAGGLALLFMPQTQRLFGLVNEWTDKGAREYFVLFDPDTGEMERGPDKGPGWIINRPLFDPEERFVAVFFDEGTQEHITIFDLQTNARSKIWKIKAPQGMNLDASRDRLLAWYQ